MTNDPDSTAPSGASVPPYGTPPVPADEPAVPDDAAPVSADVPADEPVAPAAVTPPAAPEAPPFAAFPEPPPVAAFPEAPFPDRPPAPPAAAPVDAPVAAPAPAAPVVPADPAPVVAAPTPVVPAPAAPVPVVPPAVTAPPAPPPAPPAPEPWASTEAPAEPVVAAPDPRPDVTTPATPELASAVPAPEVTQDYPAPDAAPERGRRGVVVGVVAAVVLVLLVASGVAAWLGPIKESRETVRAADRREEALAQARQLALNIGTLSHKRLDEDLRRIADSTTGKARTEFDDKILKNEAYKKLVRDNQAELSTTIVRIGLEPCGNDDRACVRGDTAVALVFLDQESKNKLRPTPRVDRNRVALTLVRNGDKWLISEVQVL